jgi:hypothetical protein
VLAEMAVCPFMAPPLDRPTIDRYLAVLRSHETSDGAFPPGWEWPDESARARHASKALEQAFRRPCRLFLLEVNPWDPPYDDSPHSGTIVVPGGDSDGGIAIVLSTFGIATGWALPTPGQSDGSKRAVRRLWRRWEHWSKHEPEWRPFWWDSASPQNEAQLTVAAEALESQGYAYVPDPVLDEPYLGGRVSDREWSRWTWEERLFPHVRWSDNAARPGERASACQ